MRKVLSFVLVLALVLGSFASVFAATENKLAVGVRTVTDETKFISGLEFKVNNDAGFEGGSATLRLSIENGEWGLDKDELASNSAILASARTDIDDLDSTTAPAIYVDLSNVTKGTVSDVKVLSLTQTSIELEFVQGTSLKKDDVIIIYFRIESGNDTGDVTVKAEGEGDFNSGSYVVATVVGGRTVATVTESAKRSGRAEKFSAATIEIRETSIGAVSGQQTIVLRLPKGVEWHTDTKISGSMGAVTADGDIVADTDKREYKITFTPTASTSARRTVVIEPVINITKDASKGDIEVDVRVSGSGNKLIEDATGLVIAIYGDENVSVTSVKESDLPEIVSGFEKQTNGKPYIVEVTLEEELPDSLVASRFIDFKFPEHVQLVAGEYVKVKMNSGSMTATKITGDTTKDMSEFEWQVPTLRSGRTDKFVFEIPVTVEAGFEGDIELEVTGGRAGVNDTTLVVGTAIAPIKVEAQLADVRTGVQNQATTDIVIKENLIGGIRDEKNENVVEVYLDDPTGSNMDFKDAKFEVTGGDLEIKSAKIEKGVMKITIDGSSRKAASEITISGVEVTLDRTPAEGKYELAVGGDAVVNNAAYNDKDFDDAAVRVDYLNIITPADSNVYGEAKFVIGQASYSVLVNGKLEERTMDAAPYIDASSRTMVPMRYVANALGVTDDNIVYNNETRTATFFKGDRIAVITADSTELSVNGATIYMDTTAVIKDSRVYVPMRYVANALGGTVDWDQPTQTVTINQ